MAEHSSPETSALTADQRCGRLVLAVILAALLTPRLMVVSALLLCVILGATASPFAPLMHSTGLALAFVLFYAVWIGQRWARWFIVGLCALGFLRSIVTLVAGPDLLGGIFSSVYLVSGGILAFSKSVSAFLSYQQVQRCAGRNQGRRRVLTMVAGILVLAAGVGSVLYVQARNRWPESFKRRLSELKAGGVPITLAQCDLQYRALGSDPRAVQHFQRAFAAMSKGQLPLMGARKIAQPILHPALPGFSEMASPVQRALVASCLQSNAVALRLLHEGMSYDRCLFPINLADGFQALLPHLEPCAQGAHLLALESIENLCDGDPDKAAGSVIASLHMAEILRDEPDLVGIPIRNRIVATACVSLRTCLNVAPFSARDLAIISARLQGAMEACEKGLRPALVEERCQGISIFQGSNQQIADFLEEGRAGPGVRLSVEAIRAQGILQRDAAYFVDCLDRIEAASTNASRERRAVQLANIASEVEQNRHFAAAGDKKRCNIISCLLLPGVIRAIQADLWTQTLAEVTLVAIAVERHRQEFGRLPSDLDALVPTNLARVPENPYTGQPIGFRLLPKGYIVNACGMGGRDTGAGRLARRMKSESDEIVFRVER